MGTLRPLKDVLRLGEQLEIDDGLRFGTPEHRDRMRRALAEPVDERCRECGGQMVRLDLCSGRCEKCRKALDEGDQDEARITRMRRVDVAPAYRHCTFQSYRGEVPDVVVEYAIGRSRKPLLVWGKQTGVGKTHLATACLYSLEAAGKRCWWVASVNLARALSLETFDPEQRTFRRAVAVEYLLIDDLGDEVGVTPKAKELVSSVLHERVRANRPTIITTNMTDEELCDYDARIASRLLGGDVVHQTAEDDARWIE